MKYISLATEQRLNAAYRQAPAYSDKLAYLATLKELLETRLDDCNARSLSDLKQQGGTLLNDFSMNVTRLMYPDFEATLHCIAHEFDGVYFSTTHGINSLHINDFNGLVKAIELSL